MKTTKLITAIAVSAGLAFGVAAQAGQKHEEENIDAASVPAAVTKAAEAHAKGITLRLAWPPDMPRRVTGDPGRIRQVIAALVRDALARLQHGEVVIEVAEDHARSAGWKLSAPSCPWIGGKYLVGDTLQKYKDLLA